MLIPAVNRLLFWRLILFGHESSVLHK